VPCTERGRMICDKFKLSSMNFRPPYTSNGCLDSRIMETIVNDTRTLTVHTLYRIFSTRIESRDSYVRSQLRRLRDEPKVITCWSFQLGRIAARLDRFNVDPSSTLDAGSSQHPYPSGQLLPLSIKKLPRARATTPIKVNAMHFRVSCFKTRSAHPTYHHPTRSFPWSPERPTKDIKLTTKFLPGARQWDSHAGSGRSWTMRMRMITD
jgi:hypothetical protein